ncbi:hypothetical protein cypCar_00015736 [Cyprinus carpio]|nr:hypothetical protein cypCar_00015736 [Cyprinus carpio]
MCEHGDGDGDAEASSSATLRPPFALGRALPGRISLNPPPPGRLTSLRSRDLTLGGYKKVALSKPLYQMFTLFAKLKMSIFAVKEETASDNALKSAKDEQKYPVPVRGTSACPQQPTVGELFQQLSVSDKEELLFIQLPDTIPGQPKTSSPEKPRKEGKTQDKRSSQMKALVLPHLT